MKLNKIYCSDSSNMKEVADGSVQLIVTSPPYNVKKPYDNHDDGMPLEDYLEMLNKTWKECVRVLCDGGRLCVNIANTWRNPYLPLHSYIIHQLLDLGLLMRGEVIWDKGASVGSSTAWGSWKSPSNPTLRDVHEYIMVFSKKQFNVPNDRESDMTRDEFMAFTKSIWNFPTVSAKRIGHPAPFPEELPRRLIKFYTFPKDVVLDPFIGAGTTAIAAKRLGRHYVGYDISKEYCDLAEKRIKKEFSQTTLKHHSKTSSKS